MSQIINANNKERIETGALRINDDWTGLFIRGDDCFSLQLILSEHRKDANIVEDIFAEQLIEAIENDVLHK